MRGVDEQHAVVSAVRDQKGPAERPLRVPPERGVMDLRVMVRIVVPSRENVGAGPCSTHDRSTSDQRDGCKNETTPVALTPSLQRASMRGAT
jgi:hypothetical protein